jgi:hypothetical protein
LFHSVLDRDRVGMATVMSRACMASLVTPLASSTILASVAASRFLMRSVWAAVRLSVFFLAMIFTPSAVRQMSVVARYIF